MDKATSTWSLKSFYGDTKGYRLVMKPLSLTSKITTVCFKVSLRGFLVSVVCGLKQEAFLELSRRSFSA